ncbi:MAG: ABC transporter permease [Gemmatimonadales bacterium]|jgi:predicted permease
MDTLAADLRYALRRLTQHPGFTIIAVLTIALGVGANSAIFSVVNAVLLRPLPVESPDELVEIYSQEGDEEPVTQAYPDYLDIRAREDLFSGVAGYTMDFFNVSLGQEPEVMLGESVSADYFEVLGVPAALGRAFIPGEDDAPGAPAVTVISHALWQRRFAGDPAVLGRTFRVRGQPVEIIGVAPEKFKGLMVGFASELWLPLTSNRSFAAGDDLRDRGSRWLLVKGRLRPGVTVEQARAGLDVLADQLAAAYPETNGDPIRRFPVIPTSDVRLHPVIDRALVPVAALLMTVVGLLLLIVCTNLANLLLARALTRRKEIAIRLAVGAGRGRLVRQLLTESMLVAVLGGGLGLLVAWGTLKLLVGFQPPILIKLSLDLGIDGRVLAFTFFVALLAGVLFGLAPALQSTRPQLTPALKDEMEAVTRKRRTFGLSGSLVVVQVAVSLVLLVGAGLFLRSLIGAQTIDPGFERQQAAIMTIAPTLSDYDEAQTRNLYTELRQRTQALPGVESVTLASRLPLGVSINTNELFVEGVETPENEAPSIDITVVSPGYFETMEVPLLQGRDFSDGDDESAPRVVIIDEAAARRFWPGENPIGRRLRLGSADGELHEIVGVAQTTKVRTLGEDPRPYLYLPLQQRNRGIVSLVVGTHGDPAAVLPLLRREALLLDPNLPIMELKTMSQHLSIMLFAPRMGGILLGVFGALAILLATIGLYGVVSYAAARRTREVGIRVALGARPGDVVRLVIGQGMVMVGVGAAIGLALALAATRPLGAFLYGVAAWDPATFLGITALLVGVAFLAMLVPAMRAVRLDPLVALRRE